jgi:hypothetical protein
MVEQQISTSNRVVAWIRDKINYDYDYDYHKINHNHDYQQQKKHVKNVKYKADSVIRIEEDMYIVNNKKIEQEAEEKKKRGVYIIQRMSDENPNIGKNGIWLIKTLYQNQM